MYRIYQFACILFFFIYSQCCSQQIEHMVPVGFNNPFLKSGQYISSIYFESFKSRSDSKEDQSGNEMNQYSINWTSYIGITDEFTLRFGLIVNPQQTYIEGLYNRGGDTKNSFYMNPEVVLSYRPDRNIEIFGLLNYSEYKRSFTESIFTAQIPVIDNNGNVIYEDGIVTSPARPDINQVSTYIKFGITYSGNFW